MSLDRLDTAIAFAVVMLGVSLLITILTQMVSAVLGLRGTNLRWGIKTVLTSLDPSLKDAADKIANNVLHSSAISDSIFSRLDNEGFWGKLTSRWRLASAISPAELVRCLRAIATDVKPKETTASASKANATTVGSTTTRTVIVADPPQSKPPATAPKGVEIAAASAIQSILDDTSDSDMGRRINLLRGAFNALGGPTYAVQLDKILQQMCGTAEQSVGKLEAVFATTMDRVSQRFSMHMRLCTIFLAFVIALGLHIDSFDLLKQLATNADVRAGLVGISQSMQNEAIAIQGGSVPLLAGSVAPAALKDAMQRLIKSEADAQAIHDEIPNFSNTDEAVQWLSGRLPNLAADRKTALAAQYRKLLIMGLKERADNINKQLAQAGFQLIPTPYPGVFHWSGWRSFLGELVAAAFLSLGAPFWFNALKSLSNLRTVVAKQQEQPA